MKTHSAKSIILRIVALYLPLLTMAVFTFAPFYWTLNTSFKREADINQIPIKYWPDPVTVQNYVTMWKNMNFSRYFLNSVFISTSVALIVVLFALLTGYALTRFKFKGKAVFFLVLLSTQFFGGEMLLIPLFMIFKFLHLINSPFSLILTYATFEVSFNSILIMGFFSNVPVELEEAAMIDGCSRVKAIFKVILPIILPGIVATGFFAFISAWKEFLFAVMLINDPARFTIPVGLSYMMGELDINYGALAAGGVVAIIPSFILFAYIQKYLVQNLTAGAVKG
jgi:multiple sugar transport system permease protein